VVSKYIMWPILLNWWSNATLQLFLGTKARTMCVKGLTSLARSWEKQRTKHPLKILLTRTPDREVLTKKPVIDIQHKVNSTHNKKIAEPHYSSIWASWPMKQLALLWAIPWEEGKV
jgi:hypothetical protein